MTELELLMRGRKHLVDGIRVIEEMAAVIDFLKAENADLRRENDRLRNVKDEKEMP